jgi:hypothetical protein
MSQPASKATTSVTGAEMDDIRGGARSVRVPGHQVGSLVRWSADGPIVDFPGNPHGPLLARSFLPPGHPRPGDGDEVLLVFEGERSHRPVLVGVGPQTQPTTPLEATVDGQRVVIEGREEIVLRCGQASITLRRNGRIVVRGTYVETHAQGVNRIKGGSVRIN